ncbi:hypothetical protein OG21DRAFT_1482468 [Imleria badia]|nr:hypothetical protein OG21DRAFT_1482468 [Imleria badia]
MYNRPPKGSTRKKLAPTPDGTPTLAEQLSFLHLPRPFKSAAYAKNTNRRTKNVNVNAPSGGVNNSHGRSRPRTLTGSRRKRTSQRHPLRSFLPDITATSPDSRPRIRIRARLRSHDKSVYDLIKNLSPGVAKTIFPPEVSTPLSSSSRSSGPTVIWTLSCLYAVLVHEFIIHHMTEHSFVDGTFNADHSERNAWHFSHVGCAPLHLAL